MSGILFFIFCQLPPVKGILLSKNQTKRIRSTVVKTVADELQGRCLVQIKQNVLVEKCRETTEFCANCNCKRHAT